MKDPAERRRLSWITAYQAFGDAGAVCRRFGISRPTLRKRLHRHKAEGEAGLRDHGRRPHRSPGLKVDKRQEERILDLRRERRLGVKRIRHETRRLHEVRLSVATVHEALARNLTELPSPRTVHEIGATSIPQQNPRSSQYVWLVARPSVKLLTRYSKIFPLQIIPKSNFSADLRVYCMRRALIFKLGAIGDVLMVIPAAYALYQQGYAIDWVCGASVASLLALYPWINVIVANDRAIMIGGTLAKAQAVVRLWRALPRAKYDLCAMLYYDRRYKGLVLPIRADRKIFLSNTERAFQLLPGRHHTDEYARILLAYPDGERVDSLAPVRPTTMPASPLPSTGKKRILIAAAGARNMLRDDALRRWPIEFYVELARQLLAHGLEVVLIGGPDDRWASPEFAGLPVTDCIGQFTLTETLGLMDAAQVLATHDTGPLHLAGLTKVGILGLFGPTDPRGRLPRRADAIALWGGEGYACRPCYDGREFAPCLHNGCLDEITPAMVVKQTLALLTTELSSFRIMTPREAAGASLEVISG